MPVRILLKGIYSRTYMQAKLYIGLYGSGGKTSKKRKKGQLKLAFFVLQHIVQLNIRNLAILEGVSRLMYTFNIQSHTI